MLPIHGTLARNRCFHDCLGEPTYLTDDEIIPGADGVPACLYCGRWARPDVVWFGEMLPQDLIDRAVAECRRADVLLSVGTSAVVQPAASLPPLAWRTGARVIDVNPVHNAISEIASVWLNGLSGEVLPRVVAALRTLRTEGAASYGA